MVLNPDSPIDAFLSQCQTPVIIIVANQIWQPADWASFQASLVALAQQMKQYAVVTRYSSVDLSNDVIQVNTSPIAQTSAISLNATKSLIAAYNNGQTLNVLVYDGTVMQGHPSPVGGCEWQGQTLNSDPVTAFASALYNGPAFEDANARIIFHELIHELFSITKQTDTLHEYLEAHGGYAANTWADLAAVFTGNSLNTPSAVETLEADERSLEN